MTLDEWKEVAEMMNLLYDDGKLMFTVDDKPKLLAWYSCLADLNYEGVAKAVRNLVMKSPYKPKVADIRKEYFLMTSAVGISEAEAWSMVREGIRNGIYGSTEEFAKFPPMVQKAVGSPDSLSEWAMMSAKEIETVVQSQFLNCYRAESARVEADKIVGQIGVKRGQLAGIEGTDVERLEEK